MCESLRVVENFYQRISDTSGNETAGRKPPCTRYVVYSTTAIKVGLNDYFSFLNCPQVCSRYYVLVLGREEKVRETSRTFCGFVVFRPRKD